MENYSGFLKTQTQTKHQSEHNGIIFGEVFMCSCLFLSIDIFSLEKKQMV